jgi:Predicted outer membrane lipoprotein
MKAFTTSILALAMAATAGTASAQSAYGDAYGSAPYGNAQGAYQDGYYDYARVIRVAPVIGAPGGYPAQGQRCTTRNDGYVDGYGDGYGNDGYGYPDRDGYYRGEPQRGTSGGRTMATVVGSVLGAVIGSQVGGGSARYATSAIGTAVGGLAGQQVYDQAHRERQRASVTVCDPVDANRPYYGGTDYGGNGNLFDVTYEYGGRTHTTRTNYNPGERIRVRVDVRAE